jgi:hypothetical protein
MKGKEIISSSRVVFEDKKNLDEKIKIMEKEILELKEALKTAGKTEV